MLRLVLFLAFVPYPHVQADANFRPAAPNSKNAGLLIVHLHNTGDLAASCTVKAGGQSRITGVSPSGETYVFFDTLTNYKGYTVACQVN